MINIIIYEMCIDSFFFLMTIHQIDLQIEKKIRIVWEQQYSAEYCFGENLLQMSESQSII